MTLEGVTQYAESTSSTLLYLLLASLHQSHSESLSHAASHVGIAHSFATLLRALPFHASRRRMVIPVEITAKHGVRQEEVFRLGGDAKGIDDAVFEFATVANDHILTARSAFKDSGVPREAMPVFLSAVSGSGWSCFAHSTNAWFGSGASCIVLVQAGGGQLRCICAPVANEIMEASDQHLERKFHTEVLAMKYLGWYCTTSTCALAHANQHRCTRSHAYSLVYTSRLCLFLEDFRDHRSGRDIANITIWYWCKLLSLTVCHRYCPP